MLDRGGAVISYAGMQRKIKLCSLWELDRILPVRSCSLRRSAIAVVASFCLFAAGCTPAGLQKHAAALSAATAPVVDQAAVAYRRGNEIHLMKADYDAIAAFDKKDPVYDPRKTQPLLSEKDVEIRLTVLKAFQCYVQKLEQILNGTSSPELDAASTSLGGSLTTLANSGSSSSETAPVSPATQQIITTGINALGQFLVSKKIKQELPGSIKEMDPQLEALCDLLKKEIDLLRSQEKLDFDAVLDDETLYLRDPASKLSTEERRLAIMKLPELARKQADADAQLVRLRGAVSRLALTHHALAADAQGNNPESLSAKIGELVVAGRNLGRFYSSL